MTAHPAFRVFTCLIMLSAVLAVQARAQPLSLSLESARTSLTIETTTPVEVLAQFSAKITGARLSSGVLTAPDAVTSNLLPNETATQLALANAFVPSQTTPYPSAALDAVWPAGAYGIHLDWSLANGTPKTGDYIVEASLAWPVTPVVQTPRPLFPLAAQTVEFEWSPWLEAPATGGGISLSLYEGLITITLLQQIAAGDLSGLETFSVVAVAAGLAPTTTTHTASGIDPELDHILVLEFSQRVIGATTPTPAVSRTSRMVTFFYRDNQTTYDEWRAEQFPGAEATDEAISGPEADPDADGWVNLLEYAAATPPLVSDVAAAPVISRSEETLRVDHWVNTAALDLVHGYERMEVDLSWRPLAPEEYTLSVIAVQPGREIVRMTPLATTGRDLFRVRVSLQP